MDNKISTLSVSELFELNFIVPAYQRGFRWSQRQVVDLLDDIYGFASKKDKSDKEFYCLQPIILQQKEFKGNDVYEIIDGQQRLTTLKILLTYLEKKHFRADETLESEYGKAIYDLQYETRPDTARFLQDLNESDEQNIDFYYISQAYNHIKNWFESHEQKRAVRDTVLRTLVHNEESRQSEGLVKVIWYEITDAKTNPIDIFIRINLGKISLTNAELIKALFLQERNFGIGDAAKLKQLEIAQDWDYIENELQEENFWWFLNQGENTASSHIELIFDLMRSRDNKEAPDLEESLGTDQYQTFRYFNQKLGSEPGAEEIKKVWEEVKWYFSSFKEWYEHPTWYHYIGFLIYCNASIKGIVQKLDPDKVATKADVTEILEVEIKKQFKKVNWVTTSVGKEEAHLNLNYKSDKNKLRQFYLMFNLEYIVQKSRQENLIYKFPFKAFKVGNSNKSWDIEHIDSATENPLVDFDEQKEWLKNAKLDLNLSIDLVTRIDKFLTQEKETEGTFERLYEEVIAISGETEIGPELKNSIGNLTLLDAGTNRGYGNALFSTKRRTIIEKDKKGVFIPICTKHVFLKYFDGNLQNKWTEEDILNYRDTLEETMSKFIKPATHEEI